jgi:excisionase family DNA binding protein
MLDMKVSKRESAHKEKGGRTARGATPPISRESATLTPRESRQITRFGLNYTYALLQSGEMPAIRVGKRFFIPKAALLKWLENAGSRPLNAA